MKLKLLALSALLVSGGTLCAQSKNFVLNGKIKELKDGEQVMLLYHGNSIIDTLSTTIVKDGSFTLQGSVVNPICVTLTAPEKKRYSFFFRKCSDDHHRRFSKTGEGERAQNQTMSI